MDEINYTLEPIAVIHSELVALRAVPKQGDDTIIDSEEQKEE